MKLAFKFDDGRVVSHEVFERTFSIGRSESCRVSLDSEHFSREHCLIELIDGTVYLTDLGSKNGVFINHVRIPPRLRISVDLRLPVYLGECFLSIDIKEDLRDPDHLTLETHPHVAPEELYRPVEPPKRIPTRPAPSSVKTQDKKILDGKSILIGMIILAAVTAFHFTRNSVVKRTEPQMSSE